MAPSFIVLEKDLHMDVKQYFRKLREIESSLHEEFPTVVSMETPDGGRAGIVSQVSRANAAKLIAEGRAVLASDEQRAAFQKAQTEAMQAVQHLERTRQVQIAFLSDADLQAQLADRRRGNGKG